MIYSLVENPVVCTALVAAAKLPLPTRLRSKLHSIDGIAASSGIVASFGFVLSNHSDILAASSASPLLTFVVA